MKGNNFCGSQMKQIKNLFDDDWYIESSHYQHKIQTLKLNQENQINVLWQFSITFSVALHMTNWTRQLLYGSIEQSCFFKEIQFSCRID